MNVKQKKLVELTLHASYPCQFQILEIFPRGFEIQLTYLSNLWEKVLYVMVKDLMGILSLNILYFWEC